MQKQKERVSSKATRRIHDREGTIDDMVGVASDKGSRARSGASHRRPVRVLRACGFGMCPAPFQFLEPTHPFASLSHAVVNECQCDFLLRAMAA